MSEPNKKMSEENKVRPRIITDSPEVRTSDEKREIEEYIEEIKSRPSRKKKLVQHKSRNIPSKEELEKLYLDSIKEFKSSLDYSERDGLIAYLKVPFIILVPVVLSYFLGFMRFSLIYVVIVIVLANKTFSSAVGRFKTSIRHLVYREAQKFKYTNLFESTEWFNYISRRVWPYVEPVVSKEVLKQANIVLAENTPAFLSELKLSEFTLGSFPPYLKGIKFYEQAETNKLRLDFSFYFLPLESDKPSYSFITLQPEMQYNSRIVLSTLIGPHFKGIGVRLPILVKEISFEGVARVELTLTRDANIIDDVEFCFLTMPKINFDLKPLKAVNVMDVPGLSAILDKIITLTLTQQVVNPNSIRISLKPSAHQEHFIGILFIHLFDLANKKDLSCRIELGIDGVTTNSTRRYSGHTARINEYFYIKIRSLDEFLKLSLLGASNVGLAEGYVNLNKVRSARVLLENVHFEHNDSLYSVLNSAVSFYPIKNNPTNAGIITLEVIGVSNIRKRGDFKGTGYDLSVEAVVFKPVVSKPTVSKKIKGQDVRLFDSAILHTRPVEEAERLLAENRPPGSATSSTFYAMKTDVYANKTTVKFNTTMEFYSRDLSNDIIYFILKDKNETLGTFRANCSDIRNEDLTLAPCMPNLLSDGELAIRTRISFIQDKISRSNFTTYKYLMKLGIAKIKSVHEQGVCYVLAATESLNYVIPVVFGTFPLKREIMIPMKKNESVRLSLYKEEVEYLGTGILIKEGALVDENLNFKEKRSKKKKDDQSGRVYAGSFLPLRNKRFPIGRRIRSQVSLWKKEKDMGHLIVEGEISELSKTADKKGFSKVLQVRFSRFKGFLTEFYIQFLNENGDVIKSSRISNEKNLSECFTLFTLTRSIEMHFISSEIGGRILIGKTLIEPVDLNVGIKVSSEVSCWIESKVQSAPLSLPSTFDIGYLKMKILRVSDININKVGDNQDFYLKLLLNENKIFSTGIIRNKLNPEFDEELTIKVNSNIDILRLELKDHNRLSANLIFYYRLVPLYFLNEGKFTHTFFLQDADTFEETNTSVQIIMEYSKELSDTEQVIKPKKRFIFSW